MIARQGDWPISRADQVMPRYLVGTLLVWWRLPASRHFVANRSVQGALDMLWRHLHNWRLMASCAVGFCVLFSLVGAFTYVNLYLAAAPFNLSTAGLANMFAVYLVGVLVTPLAGRHIEQLGFMKALLWVLAWRLRVGAGAAR